MKAEIERMLTVSELADYLGVKPVTIYSWVRSRKIPHIVLSAGRRKECVRFKLSVVDEWLERREREAKPCRIRR